MFDPVLFCRDGITTDLIASSAGTSRDFSRSMLWSGRMLYIKQVLLSPEEYRADA